MDVLIESGARITEVDNDGRIPMILGAQEGHLPVVASLVESGSPLESRAHDGKTALRVAAIEGHKDVVHFLLCNKADCNYRDADGRSTLYVLALENSVQVAGLLLENTADVEACDLEGRTPLHVAAWQGHYDMTQQLLKHGACVNAVDNDYRTALQSAAWQGNADIVKLLLEHSAQVDHTCNQGATALCIASQEGHEGVVRVLLDHQADPNHADQFGRTATRVALKGGHNSVVKLLEQNGADNVISSNKVSGCDAYASCDAVDGKGCRTSPGVAAVRRPKQIAHDNHSDSPNSTFEQRKSCLSIQSLGCPNSSNTSTNHSSSSGIAEPHSPSSTFTQQLQQCSRNRGRPLSKVLTPVSEPHSPNSPGGSPLSDPLQSPDLMFGTHPDYMNNDIRIYSNPSTERQGDEPIWMKHAEGRISSTVSVTKLENKSEPDLDKWSKAPGIVMGQAASSMKSPDTRRKRNGIVTNPKYAKNVSMNGYMNKLAGLPDSIDAFPINNHGGGSSSLHSKQPKPRRPSGLPLKKETPL